jgi:hypothetical protein
MALAVLGIFVRNWLAIFQSVFSVFFPISSSPVFHLVSLHHLHIHVPSIFMLIKWRCNAQASLYVTSSAAPRCSSRAAWPDSRPRPPVCGPEGRRSPPHRPPRLSDSVPRLRRKVGGHLCDYVHRRVRQSRADHEDDRRLPPRGRN